MNAIREFQEEVQRSIAALEADADLRGASRLWAREVARKRYTHNFSWMGRPIIQFPQDIVGMQELIWKLKPDLVIETGIAHGGSIVFYASMMELLGGNGHCLGVDIDIRAHNREQLEQHPMRKRFTLHQGSSIAPETIAFVRDFAARYERVMVVLDSNHTHEHVMAELNAYSSLVKEGGYLVVFDTIIEDYPDDFFPDRPWGRGNNPKTAVREFLASNDRFEIDSAMESHLLVTVAPEGYLRCVKD